MCPNPYARRDVRFGQDAVPDLVEDMVVDLGRCSSGSGRGWLRIWVGADSARNCQLLDFRAEVGINLPVKYEAPTHTRTRERPRRYDRLR